MRAQIVLGICVTLLLTASMVSANTVWNPAANGIVPPAVGNWGDTANWANGLPVAAGDGTLGNDPKAVFNVLGAAECQVTDPQVCRQLVMADGGDAAQNNVLRIMDGGSLTTGDVWSSVGFNNPGHMIVETGGSVTFGNHMWIGHQDGGVGILDIIGGNIRVEQMTGLGWNAGGIGTLNLIAGVLDLHNLNAGGLKSIGEGSVFDITNGVLLLDGNQTGKINDFYTGGRLVGFGGKGDLNWDFDERNAGKTTVTAVHPFDPLPSTEGGILFVAGDVELSWTLPDPVVPGQPVLVDVYITEDYDALMAMTDAASMRVVSQQAVTSVVVPTNAKTRYYWAVDTYVGDPNDPVFGSIFSFIVDNQAPRVSAGADVVTWLQDGPRVGTLDATVTDEDPYTVSWTVVSEPNVGDAVIEAATAEDTTVTLLAVGEYVLQLEASDGEYAGSDTVTINVYGDSCQAAQSVPGYEPLVGDLNGDCIVDEADLALLEENWLQDSSLTDDWFLLP